MPATPAYAPARPDDYVRADDQARTNGGPSGMRLDAMAVAAFILLAFLVLRSALDRTGQDEQLSPAAESGQAIEQEGLEAAVPEIAAPSQTEQDEGAADPPLPPVQPADPLRIVYPYDDYWITQGLHGFSYGHMAIDIAAGKGALVKSPIHGSVTANYVDQYGNTTLVIENDVYVVTLLHGDYTVLLGQAVSLGDVVGTEGNNGYTTDMQGRSCRNRDCGYHSHLNIYSKTLQANVNPLEVLQ